MYLYTIRSPFGEWVSDAFEDRFLTLDDFVCMSCRYSPNCHKYRNTQNIAVNWIGCCDSYRIDWKE